MALVGSGLRARTRIKQIWVTQTIREKGRTSLLLVTLEIHIQVHLQPLASSASLVHEDVEDTLKFTKVNCVHYGSMGDYLTSHAVMQCIISCFVHRWAQFEYQQCNEEHVVLLF